MADNQTISELNRLIRICLDGEAGFLVVAESVRNRGLKALFKTFAAQRGQFANVLQEEVKKLGGSPRTEGTMMASLHRGWINIKTAMTIGQYGTENVALAESERGESTAVRTYEKVLDGSLPAEIRSIVEGQHFAIKAVHRQIQEMQGGSGTRIVVRLFDDDNLADAAVGALSKAGFAEERIQRIDLGEIVTIYENKGNRSPATESAGAGAFGGTIFGAIVGLILGMATLLVPEINMMGDMGAVPTLIIVTLAGAGIGAGFGLLFGALIGRGTAEEDTYLYAESVVEGCVLLTVETDSERAQKASEIMLQINASHK